MQQVHKSLWILLTIGIIHQCAEEYATYGFAIDKAIQIGASSALISGRGLETFQADSADLSRPIRKPVVGWPPGYSLFLAPLLWVTDDIWWSAIVIDWTSVIIFFASWFLVLKSLDGLIDTRGQILILLYWAFVYPPLMSAASSSDKLALALFSASLSASLWLMKRRGSPILLGTISALFAGAAAAVRFSYWPLLAVTPIALSFCAVTLNRRLWRAALSNTIIAACSIGAIAIYQHRASGHTTYLSEHYPKEVRGLYWDHLLHFTPFPTSALGLNGSWSFAADLLHLPGFIRVTGPWVASVIMLFVFGVHAAFYLKPSEIVELPKVNHQTATFFLVSGILSIFLTVIMLSYLSVRTPYQTMNGALWTYVEEDRYFAPTWGFLIVGLVSYVFSVSRSVTNRYRKPLVVSVVSVLLVTTFLTGLRRHGGWWLWVTGKRQNLQELYRPGQKDSAVLMDIIKRQARSDLPIIYMDDNQSRLSLAVMTGVWTYDTRMSEKTDFRTSKTVRIILALPRNTNQDKNNALAEFCRVNGGRKVADLTEVTLFEVQYWPKMESGDPAATVLRPSE